MSYTREMSFGVNIKGNVKWCFQRIKGDVSIESKCQKGNDSKEFEIKRTKFGAIFIPIQRRNMMKSENNVNCQWNHQKIIKIRSEWIEWDNAAERRQLCFGQNGSNPPMSDGWCDHIHDSTRYPHQKFNYEIFPFS